MIFFKCLYWSVHFSRTLQDVASYTFKKFGHFQQLKSDVQLIFNVLDGQEKRSKTEFKNT